ncbi:MAG: hypothetical protein ACPLRY_07780 [Candidatus Bathyarchaeales archaeon]
MTRRKLYPAAKPVGFYADLDVFNKFKKLVEAKGSTVSEELNIMIRERVAQFEGVKTPILNPAEYDALKREYIRLSEEGRNISRKITKSPHYRELRSLAIKLGLDTRDFSNVGQITPRLLAEWKGPLSEAHNFITLLEMSSKMAKLEQRLTEIRKQMAS